MSFCFKIKCLDDVTDIILSRKLTDESIEVLQSYADFDFTEIKINDI